MSTQHVRPQTPILLILVLAALVLPTRFVAAEIDWTTDLDSALGRAQETERNLFVLVTAPSWCPQCRELDNGVLAEQSVTQWINRNYVPVRLEDSNPQHLRLEAPSMPSMFVLDPSGAVIALRSGIPAMSDLRDWITSQSVVLSGRKVAVENGLFHRKEDGVWDYYRRGEKTVLQRYDRDERFSYLRESASSERYYAVSNESEAAFAWNNAEQAWEQLPPAAEGGNGVPEP